MSRGEISESIKVYIRERPVASGFASQENGTESQVGQSESGVKNVSEDKKSCTYYSASNKVQQTFTVDKYFDPCSEQSELFEEIALPIVESAFLGYSGTILAYGPTSSGKTHTMRGGDEETRGIMPRCIERLLKQQETTSCEIWASYLQIYCEVITDLLWQPSPASADTSEMTVSEHGGSAISAYSANQPLLLRERAGTTASNPPSVYVEGLSRYRIQSVEDLWQLLQRGDTNRSTAATNMNETSSRSHAVLIVKVLTPDDVSGVAVEGGETVSHRESTLMLVDLAGSERASASAGRHGARLEEAKAINLSLSALGNCMSALASESNSGDKSVHIPYRDSKLTRLLQGCLGGSSRTAVVVTLAPGSDQAGESLSALRFASRASKVKVSATVTRVRDYEALYREAKQKLREFQSGNAGGSTSSEASLAVKVSEQAEALQSRDRTIEQHALEISMLRQQLQALQSSNGSASSGAAALVPVDSGGAQLEEDKVNLRGQLDSVNKQHALALETAHRAFQSKLQQAQQAEQVALRELSAKQSDLKAERERSLQTMRQLREAQERRQEDDEAQKGRTAELLEELTTLREESDDLQAKNEMLVAKVRELAAQLDDSVSKAQVQEMEGLFLETVTKLSDRVNMLEGTSSRKGGSAGTAGAGGGIAMGSNSSSCSNREVRIEPGGRIRATSSTASQQQQGNNSGKFSGSGKQQGGMMAAGMQHSRSSSAVSMSSSSNNSGEAGKQQPTAGKLW